VGQGRFYRFQGDMEPATLYGDFVRKTLSAEPGLHPWTKKVLGINKSESVLFSIQEDGHLLAINYSDEQGRLELPGVFAHSLEPYQIIRPELK
jgi:hypothetical protein